MRFHRLGKVLVVALAMRAGRASAFLDPPYISPAQPRAGEMVVVNIHGGVCDAIVGLPGYPQITVQGNDIHMLLFSVHYDDPELCNLGTGTATFALGAYSVGSHTLIVERRYMTISGPWAEETLGIIPFAVASASQRPTEASTLNAAGLAALLLALIAAAHLTLRSRYLGSRFSRWGR